MFAQETKKEKSEEIKREQTIFISFSVFRFAFFKEKKQSLVVWEATTNINVYTFFFQYSRS